MKYVSGNYRGSSKLLYFYNGTNLTEYITQQWKTHLSAFRNTSRNVYNYNTINKTDTFFAQTWDTVSTIWRPSNFTKYFYNIDSTTSNATTYKYFTHLGGYRVYSKSDYAYSGGLLNLTMSYNWDTLTTTWIKTSRKTYTYNGLSQKTADLSEAWDNINSTWKNSYKDEYTYNGSSNEWASYVLMYWQSGDWSVGFKSDYFYGCATPSTVDEISEAEKYVNVYPNPAQGNFTIEISSAALNRYNMIDLAGRKLQSGNIEIGNNQVSVNELPKGIYLIQLQGSQGVVVVKKVVVE
ncbi:MAG: T9SS type A sorting domain-containing protein [Bacteroidetes bacterium]|nr:T9SS type A sorting domain-containing protein [Bacteroidota bacterium]